MRLPLNTSVFSNCHLLTFEFWSFAVKKTCKWFLTSIACWRQWIFFSWCWSSFSIVKNWWEMTNWRERFLSLFYYLRIYVCDQINRCTSEKDDFVNVFVLILMILLMLIVGKAMLVEVLCVGIICKFIIFYHLE